MSSYDSPIGSKKFAGPSMREIDVPDESGYSESLPIDRDQINAMRKRSGGPPINED